MSKEHSFEAAQIGEKIRHYREMRGFTQEGLAFDAGTTTTAICQIENGTREARAGLLCRIAKALSVRLSDLEPDDMMEPGLPPGMEEAFVMLRNAIIGMRDESKQTFAVSQLELIAKSYERM